MMSSARSLWSKTPTTHQILNLTSSIAPCDGGKKSNHCRGGCCGVGFRVPSRELTYPTLGKGTSSSKVPSNGDMLVSSPGGYYELSLSS